MTTDNTPATLATSKHGGCVQLGDGLLPCPFCGSPAERIDFGPGAGDNEGGSCVACPRCQASGPVEFGYKENFISNWNRRALSAQPSPGGQGATFPWENFPAYLIDKCEGDTISEEGLQQAMAAMAKDERYCLAARQPVGEPVTPWRDHSAAVDSKALATATEIALMWGKDRSQFVSRIQAAVIDAMQWMNGGLLEKPAQAEDLGQFREAVEMAMEAPLNSIQRARLERLLALIDGKAEVSRG